MEIPEFKIENKLEKFKDKDIALLEEHLQEEERRKEAEMKAKKEAENAQAAAGAPAGKGGKADPKKDAKGGAAKGGKGVAAVEDKNAPQNITVDYPDIESSYSFTIFEKNYNPKVQEAPKTKSKKKVEASNKESKNKERKDELLKIYNIERSLPISIAVLLRLNYEEPVVEEQESER